MKKLVYWGIAGVVIPLVGALILSNTRATSMYAQVDALTTEQAHSIAEYVELESEYQKLLESYKASELERERLRRVVEENCFFKPEQVASLGEAYSETVPYEVPYEVPKDIQEPLPYVE